MFKRKSFISFIALFLMSVLFLSPQLIAAPATTKTITIVHTNDTHSRIESDTGMGFAKIAAKINELRAAKGSENVLVLDGGDTLHGLPIATISQGDSIVKLLNAIGYDAMTPGNHDFNYGQERLVALSKKMDFPLIAANVKKADGTTLLLPYTIKEVAGVKIGIFGLATPETTYKTHPKNVQGLTFADPSQSAKAMVAELQGKTDVIIALAHLGLDESSTYTSEKVASEVAGIDLIIDGHSHTLLTEGKKVKDTLIVQAGEYGKALGIVNLTLDADKKVSFSPTLYTKENADTLIPDEKVATLINELKADFDTLTGEKIGSTPVKLIGEREFVRTGETNLGNLITHAMLTATGADIALTNGGGIRASIESGDITKKNIITVLPFGNYIVTLNVTGQEILAALEVGVTGYPEPAGSFPHVGGMTFTLNKSKAPGSRISDVKIKGKALDPSAVYALATNDFIAAGGDGYTMFSDNAVTGNYPALDEAVMSYINTYGTVTELTPKIKVVSEDVQITLKETAPEAEKIKVDIPDYEKIVVSDITLTVKEAPPVKITIKDSFIEYIIQYGDTLAKLAKNAGTTYEELAKINNIVDPHRIYAGSKILIPTR